MLKRIENEIYCDFLTFTTTVSRKLVVDKISHNLTRAVRFALSNVSVPHKENIRAKIDIYLLHDLEEMEWRHVFESFDKLSRNIT